ncbi:hypothetical protein [Undibacterium sp. TS12]|uniref:M949_RS01915 family surface polysaccharide biosynthesis protein n=1 Tax=Undibacterium sp. TS12 TaxID=2908202 RepID=UPI001F4C9D8F|nr:hypothetical protein [Undibacterium sp. TS12]MCH8621083.1 hypothetical protein [Undibacterium sp. TS12]
MKSLIVLLLALPVLAWGQGKNPPGTCETEAWMSAPDTLQKARVTLPLFKHYCYSDQSGSYVLYLTEKQDLKYGTETLSSAIEAHLLKIEADKSLSNIASIRDKASAEEAGMEFWSRLTDTSDIDKDGNVGAVIVYRFYNKGDDGLVDRDAFSGRIKIVMFYKGSKVVIRAVTGKLDGQRQTTATENFFALPASVQKNLIKKMEAMYKGDLYGFDNSYKFMPRKSQGN